MDKPSLPLFEPNSASRRLRLDGLDESAVRHEVLFEDRVTRTQNQSLFVGAAFPALRYLAAGISVLVLFSLLAGRAAWMQIKQGSNYQTQAEANRLRWLPVWPQRGIVYDAKGRILAENVPRFQISLTPRDLPRDVQEAQLVLGKAARLLGLAIHDLAINAQATSTSFDETFIVKDAVPYEQAVKFSVNLPDLPGFRLDVRPKRRYPFSEELKSLSHVLGYVGRVSPQELESHQGEGYLRVDEIGKAGLERSYEAELSGSVGESMTEVDAHGRFQSNVSYKPSVDGDDLHLSLDLDLQRLSEKTLRDGLPSGGTTRGAVIAMDPRDGRILSLVSWPAYDDNAFSGGVSSTVYRALINQSDQPLFPRAWSGVYPSGSTVKIVISAAALAEHIITPHTSVVSVGGIHIGPWFFPDWKAGGHGVTDVRRAIAWSVNTFFYTIGGGYQSFTGMGVDRLSEWMRKFGLGSRSGLDLPGEASGFVPSKDWKERVKGERWFVGDTYNLSIGQGDLLVTPLQVALYTSAIANGGKLPTPHIVERVVANKDSAWDIKPPARNESLADADSIETVRLGMRDCASLGSCRTLASLPFQTGAKTGTAQWNSQRPNHAWFTSFAPYDKPEIVVTVLVEEGGEGSSIAAPIAKRILEGWWGMKAKKAQP